MNLPQMIGQNPPIFPDITPFLCQHFSDEIQTEHKISNLEKSRYYFCCAYLLHIGYSSMRFSFIKSHQAESFPHIGKLTVFRSLKGRCGKVGRKPQGGRKDGRVFIAGMQV
jgi:hypothetical protein